MITVNPTVEPITLADLKVQLGITDSNSDVVLTRRITEARKWAEGHTKRSIMPQTHERRIDAFADKIQLPFPPVTGIVAVEYVNDAGETVREEWPAETGDYGRVYDALYATNRTQKLQ